MIEAVMFWNEPNNKSHWDFEIDPEWRAYASMVKLAAAAVAAENPRLTRVLGGISPIDPEFIRNMQGQGVLTDLNAVALHGFPLDWNHWPIRCLAGQSGGNRRGHRSADLDIRNRRLEFWRRRSSRLGPGAKCRAVDRPGTAYSLV
jgi:hypothetical protein